jgi:hypothetical protein
VLRTRIQRDPVEQLRREREGFRPKKRRFAPPSDGAVARRRRIALIALAAIAFLVGVVTGAGGDESGPGGSELPRGGRVVLPDQRVVGFYGHPKDKELGELGIGSPAAVAQKLERQAAEYEPDGRPVLPAFELLATVASEHPGDDGMYRSITDTATIDQYLEAARAAKMYLILDIQPGYEDFVTAVRRLEPYLEQPDVGLALDPEWRLPEGAIPGQQIGSVTADEVNQVSEYVSQIVARNNLPQKLFLVHSFTEDMIKQRGRLVGPPGLATVINADGTGTEGEKTVKYQEISRPPPTWFWGFKLFYHEDTALMSPAKTLRLTPQPSVVIYE